METIRYYTLEEAKEIIEKENKRKKATSNATRIYFIKQRICGLIMAIIGIIGAITIDLTAGAFALLGITLIFTKDKAMIF